MMYIMDNKINVNWLQYYIKILVIVLDGEIVFNEYIYFNYMDIMWCYILVDFFVVNDLKVSCYL